MPKKLLFLTSRLPYPPTSGRKNCLYHYCKYLHDVYGFEIVTASFLEEGDQALIEKKPDFIAKVHILRNPSLKSKVKNLLWETVIRQRYPLQVSLRQRDSKRD